MSATNDTPRPVNELLKEEFGFNTGQLLEARPKTPDRLYRTRDISYREGSVLSFVPRLISELTLDMAEVDWLWEGYVARGHLTLFSALWKTGKSTLISQLLSALQKGKNFAGKQTRPSRVLILSEESETMWARRRDELDLELESWILCRPVKKRLTYNEWINLLKESAKFCKENSVDLLIIDTLSGFWNVQDENNASMVASALLPINELLERSIAVLLVHHFRKSGGSEGVATRGSGALASYADILIEFSRLDGENPNDTQRVLRCFSRFEETPPEVVIDLVDGQYISRGTRAEVSKEGRLQNVLLILKDSTQPMAVSEIAEAWDIEEYGRRPVKRTIRRYLDDLLEDGRVAEGGEKLIGKTITPTYRLVSNARHSFSDNAGHSTDKNRHFEVNNARQDTPALTNEELGEIFGVDPNQIKEVKRDG